MDTKVWTSSLVTIMFLIGNGNANDLLEYDMTGEDEIDCYCSEKTRLAHLENKYKHRRFLKAHPLLSDKTAMNDELLRTAQTDNVIGTLHLLLSGAEVLYHKSSIDTHTAYDLAKESGQVLQMELLMHNGGDGTAKLHNSVMPEVKIRATVTLQGYVYKCTPSNLLGIVGGLPHGIANIMSPTSDSSRRWLLLEHGILNCFLDEKSNTAKEMLDCDKFASVYVTETEKYEYSFLISSKLSTAKPIIFATECDSDRQTWMAAIAKSICPVPLIDDFEKSTFMLAGYFHTRQGLSEWTLAWIVLDELLLVIQSEVRNEYDVRKIQSLVLQDTDCCEAAVESGGCLVVVFSRQTIYLQADMPRDTDNFLKLLQKSGRVSDGSLEKQQLNSKNIPVIVDKCINYIDLHGKMSEGIYRRSGTHSKVSHLLSLFQSSARTVNITADAYTEHDVANTLKRFFRSLNEPLLTSALYDDWIEKAAFSDHNTKLQWYKYLLCQLPQINYDTLKRLISHLHSISNHQVENLMGVQQLAAIFGPTLMTVDSDEVTQQTMIAGNTGREITVLADIIGFHQWLFEVDETEVEKDRMIDDAAKKLRNLVERNDAGVLQGSVTMLDVYVNNKQGKCITLKQICNDTTVVQVLKWVCAEANLQESSYALYEIACSGTLERPLVAQGHIQDIIQEWQNWSDEDSRSVYLCVKSGDMVQFIHSLYDFHTPLMSEMKFSDKKSYKKCYIEFKQCKLTCYKDAKANHKLGEWEVERISVYAGMEKKRSPPSEFGFTFIVKGEKMKRNKDTPYFGKCVSCLTQEETINWLAGIYKAQYPSGFHNA